MIKEDMDGKRNLKPELKEIYDRVMNTKVKPGTPKENPPTSSPEKVTATENTTPTTPPLATQSAPTPTESQPPVQKDAAPADKHLPADKPFTYSSKDAKDGKKTTTILGINKSLFIGLTIIFIIAWILGWGVFFGVIPLL